MSSLKIIVIYLLFCYSLSINFQYQKDSENKSIITQLVDEVLGMIMEQYDKFNETLPRLSRTCQKTLDSTFFLLRHQKNISDEEEYLARYYYTKLLTDSSTNVNDLSSYSNCMERTHQYDFTNFTNRKPLKPYYLTMFVDYRDVLLENFIKGIRTTNYLIGICFVENCEKDDHEILLTDILHLINLVKNEKINITVYPLNKEDYKPNPLTFFVKFIPLHIITIHIFIILFHKVIGYLFKKIKDLCCDSHQSRKIVLIMTNNLNDSHSNLSLKSDSIGKKKKDYQKNQHQNFTNYIKALFNIDNNFNFLIKTDNKNEIHNDSSLSYMNGIKGISMITILFGSVYMILFNAPITKQNVENYYENMSNLSFSLFYFGIKYAPKLLLCSSGFSLFYKYMCFLDDKYESEKALIIVKEEEMNSIKNKIDDDFNNSPMNSKSSSSYYNSSSSVISEKKREKYKLSFKYYFLFLASQLHKYILYLIILFFILYSLFDFALIFIDLGPMWSFFNKIMIESSLNFKDIFLSVICFQGYFINSLNKDSILNYFYLVYQEIYYFIISTLIIFLGYKYHLRIDRFILFIICFLWVFRIIFYFLSDLNVKEYFSFYGYALFYNSMVYNYLYYALGIYFGFLNYVIQKRYTYYECDKQKKTYLLGFTRLLKIIKKKSKLLFYILGIVFLILIIVFSCIQYLLFRYIEFIQNDNKDNNNKYIKKNIQQLLKDYDDDIFISIIMMLDSDIVVLLVNFMALFFYLKGDNYINDFLNLDFWNIFNKIYFSFILLLNPVILYVFYITESRIIFNLSNCHLYSYACGIVLFSLVILVYALLELPYKKAIRLYLKRNELKVGDKTLDIMENNSIMAKNMEIKEDLVQHKEDSFCEDDEEKDNNNNIIQLEDKFIDNENENENENEE